MVYRDDGGIVNEICSDSEGTNEFKSCARVKTASGATKSTKIDSPNRIVNMLTHLSQEVIRLLVARVSLILWKLRQEKKG